MIFQNPRGSFSFFHGAEPATFSFIRDTARVQLGPGIPAVQLVQNTKSYIESANRQYADRVVAEHRARLSEEREQVRRKIAEEERRQKILAELNKQ